MKFIIPVESIIQNKGGVIEYDPNTNKILRQYVHSKQWKRSGWRGGVIHKDYLISTDWQDLHYFNLKKWKYEKSFSKNTFNDLHYLVIHENKLYVVNTGLDAIEVFDNPMDPKFKNIIFLYTKDKKFLQREIDLDHNWNTEYKVVPHSCHPNCICFVEGIMVATCFEDHNRGKKSGCLLDVSRGGILLDKHNCHDGLLYKNDFYLSGTREHKILIITNFPDRHVPMYIDKTINIGKPGWWRGMIIKDDYLYVFASYAYGENSSCRMAVINIKTEKVEDIKRLPKHKGIQWDTIYQPSIGEF